MHKEICSYPASQMLSMGEADQASKIGKVNFSVNANSLVYNLYQLCHSPMPRS